jgi:acyl-CoA synthetase (AMP-forming)/AMP-acid ligase II
VTSLLIESLERHAHTRPGKVAVRGVGDDGALVELTWSELRTAAADDAVRFRDAHAPIVLQTPHGVRLLIGLLGALWARCTVLPLPAAMPALEVEAVRTRLARASSGRQGASASGRQGASASGRQGASSSGRQGASASGRQGASSKSERGGALLLTSSGTTGQPKIVRREQASLDALGTACMAALGVDTHDTLLLPVPLHHSYGIDMALVTAMRAGCCVEIHDRFQVAHALAALAERGITLLPAVPVIADALARVARARRPKHALRRVISAGSPLPHRVYESFLESVGLPIGQLYGATEFGSLTYNDPARPGFDPASAGLPLGDAELRVLDVDSPDLAAPLLAGTTGQLAVRTSTLLSEYVDDAEPATTQGYFLPRDLGYLGPDGALFVTGRTKLLIDIGSVKVNPFEIEAVLAQHPAVKEVVVIGVAASDTVSRLKAFIVPEPGMDPTADTLRAFARERLIQYKVPRSFEITSDVPRSATGKILRQALERDRGRETP